jgi:transcription initiation factor TFIIIB Brf1 subunit/transcription initiation factor TFIIB
MTAAPDAAAPKTNKNAVGVKKKRLTTKKGSGVRFTPSTKKAAVVADSTTATTTTTAVVTRSRRDAASSTGLFCPNCGSHHVETSDGSATGATAAAGATTTTTATPSAGTAICMDCGVVVDEQVMVSAVEFMDAAGGGGGSSMVGQFVSGSSSKAYTGLRGGRYGFSRDSRETTLANGRRRIQEVASRLRLSSTYVDAAHRLFTIAVEKNFVQGRRTVHVVAACLYIACRQEKSQHMLIDFSDALQVNVYTLGSCFLKFRRLLGLQLEIIDPALYVYRFAAHLLDDGANAVALTALRLVGRMKRDWIVAGRRPAGICAAALLIAARAHGYSPEYAHVTKILRVCGLTVQARVQEFARTPAANYSLTEFAARGGGGDEAAGPLAVLDDDNAAVPAELDDTEMDPPIFVRNKLVEARAIAIRQGDYAYLESGALDEPGATSQRRATRWRAAVVAAKGQQQHDDDDSPVKKPAKSGAKRKSVPQPRVKPAVNEDDDDDESPPPLDNDSPTTGDSKIKSVRLRKSKLNELYANLEKELCKEQAAVDGMKESVALVPVNHAQPDAADGDLDKPRTETALVTTAKPNGTMVEQWAKVYPRTKAGKTLLLPEDATMEELQSPTAPVEGRLSLQSWKANLPSSIESEIEDMFRTDEEMAQKAAIFHRINKDYLANQARKESERVAAEAANKDRELDEATQAEGQARYARKRKSNGDEPPQTTEEALLSAVSSRKVSRKINYDALSSIFDDEGGFSTNVGGTAAAATATSPQPADSNADDEVIDDHMYGMV